MDPIHAAFIQGLGDTYLSHPTDIAIIGVLQGKVGTKPALFWKKLFLTLSANNWLINYLGCHKIKLLH